jgi:CheY-like chemotaxis protein
MRFSRRELLTRGPLRLVEVVADAAALLRRVLPASISLVIEARDESAVVLADRSAVEQMLLNLGTNARDAMPEGGTITITTQRVTLDDAYRETHPQVRPGPYVCLRVDDTGHGMNAETLSRVFEPFFTTKAPGKGTGLGLAMVYGLMKQHDGMVQVYSEPDLGTSFKLYFPLATDISPVVVAAPRARPAPGNELILLVEDDAAVRRVLRRSLERAGYIVVEAADGQEALEAFEARKDVVKLIISDLNMPRLGGRELAAALRAAGHHVPILLTSGFSAGHGGDHPALADVAFLQKPWSIEDLQLKVRTILDDAATAA